MTTDQKRWEELTVYRPLTKEQLKPAYKEFTKIIADNLSHFGFKLHGRKLIKLSNDLFHVIHLDTRGSWTGLGDSFKIEIALVPVCDTDVFIRNYELTGAKEIKDIIPKLRDYYRITQEYKLLADFITRKLIDFVLPYLDKYDSTKNVLADTGKFKFDNVSERNQNLILFSELLNHTDKLATKIVTNALEKLNRIYPNKNKAAELFADLENYSTWLKSKEWDKIDNDLADKRATVFKKLKMNTSS